MPEKKSKGSDTGTKKPDSLKKETKAFVKEEGNFLVLSCAGESIVTGSKLTVNHVAKTPEIAANYIKKLTSSRPEYLCVVEKKALYSRKPQIVVKEIK